MKAARWFLFVLFFLPGLVFAQVDKKNMLTTQGKQFFSKSDKRVRSDTTLQHRTRYVTEMITPMYRFQRHNSDGNFYVSTQQLIEKALEEGGRWEVNEKGDTIIETPRWKAKRLHEKKHE